VNQPRSRTSAGNGTGYAASEVEYLHTLLYGALNQAEKNALVVRNVSAVTTLPRKVRKEITPLTFAQVRTPLLPTLKEDRLFAAYFLAFETGLRRGELLAVRWEDVDFARSISHVRQALLRVRVWDAGGSVTSHLICQEPKTTQSRRTIPLSPTCVDTLKHHRARQAEEKLLLGQADQDHGLVSCREDGRPLEPWTFAKRFYRLLAQAGLPRMRFHDTRHTFATRLLALGESPKTSKSCWATPTLASPWASILTSRSISHDRLRRS
jgi:integrase